MQNSGSRRYRLSMNPLCTIMSGPWYLSLPMSKLLRYVGYSESRTTVATKPAFAPRGLLNDGERIMTKLSHLWRSTIPSELCSLLWQVARVQRYIRWMSTLLFYTVPYRRRFTSNNQRDSRFQARRIGFASWIALSMVSSNRYEHGSLLLLRPWSTLTSSNVKRIHASLYTPMPTEKRPTLYSILTTF